MSFMNTPMAKTNLKPSNLSFRNKTLAKKTKYTLDSVIDKAKKMASQLPDDIITSILVHLPVKSIVRFKYVSKSWLSLISDSLFVKQHLRFSSTDANDSNQRIILRGTDNILSLKSCPLYSLFNNPPSLVVATEIVQRFEKPFHCDRDLVVGSCNGLLCIVIRDNSSSVYLWNPAIRELRRLPDSGFRDSIVSCGFGYDSHEDDYKVVVVLDDLKVLVYTLRSNSWRRLRGFPIKPIAPNALFVGGALNWPILRYHDERAKSVVDKFSWSILAIDLANEKYIEMPHPSNEYIFLAVLNRLQGCLCLVTSSHRYGAHVWIMKEYGVKESWIQMVTVPYPYREIFWSSSQYSYSFYLPLAYSKNGELLLEYRSHLVLYNVKDTKFRMPLIHNFQPCFKSFIYVESLVSPYCC